MGCDMPSNRLSTNIVHVHESVVNDCVLSKIYVATVCGTFYHRSHWIGRSWTWINAFVKFFLRSDKWERKNHDKGLRKTSEGLLQELENVERYAKLYFDYVNGAIINRTFLAKDVAEAKHGMSVWCSTLGHFFRDIDPATMQAIFDELGLDTGNALYTSASQMVKQCQQLLNFQEHIGISPFPFVPLANLSKNETLSRSEEKEIAAFIKQINNVSVRILHEYFISLISMWRLSSPFQLSVSSCEQGLVDRGCTLFENVDPVYADMVAALEEGQQVTCAGVTYTLGSELSGNSADNRRRVFTVQGHDDKVLVFYVCNQAQAGLDIEKHRNDPWIQKLLPERLAFDLTGIICNERLGEPPQDFGWDPGLYTTVETDKRKVALGLLWRELAEHHCTPPDDSFKTLRFDQKGENARFIFFEKDDFDLMRMERMQMICRASRAGGILTTCCSSRSSGRAATYRGCSR